MSYPPAPNELCVACGQHRAHADLEELCVECYAGALSDPAGPEPTYCELLDLARAFHGVEDFNRPGLSIGLAHLLTRALGVGR